MEMSKCQHFLSIDLSSCSIQTSVNRKHVPFSPFALDEAFEPIVNFAAHISMLELNVGFFF